MKKLSTEEAQIDTIPLKFRQDYLLLQELWNNYLQNILMRQRQIFSKLLRENPQLEKINNLQMEIAIFFRDNLIVTQAGQERLPKILDELLETWKIIEPLLEMELKRDLGGLPKIRQSMQPRSRGGAASTTSPNTKNEITSR